MNSASRERFDALVADVISELPAQARAALEEVSIVIEDHPGRELAKELQNDGLVADDQVDPHDVMGLHTGRSLPERGLAESGELPPVIHLFRESIVAHALRLRGMADSSTEPMADDLEPSHEKWGKHPSDDDDVYEEIRVTLLHEIGHHFGLDEEDLDRLGFA